MSDERQENLKRLEDAGVDTSKLKLECHICKRTLNDPDDPTTKDCGGDCLRCMANVANDPDAIKAMDEIRKARAKERPTFKLAIILPDGGLEIVRDDLNDMFRRLDDFELEDLHGPTWPEPEDMIDEIAELLKGYGVDICNLRSEHIHTS